MSCPHRPTSKCINDTRNTRTFLNAGTIDRKNYVSVIYGDSCVDGMKLDEYIVVMIMVLTGQGICIDVLWVFEAMAED